MEYDAFCELRSQFEKAAAQLTDAWQETAKPVKADFPRGFIRPLKEHYSRWPYLDRQRQRTVACVIQLCDVNRWNLNIWNIGLTAGALLEWHMTIPVIAVIETLAYEACIQSGWGDTFVKFKKCVNLLNSKGVIKHRLRDNIQELREYRNNIHLHLMDNVEIFDGKPKRYNEAVLCLHELEEQILKYWENHDKKFDND